MESGAVIDVSEDYLMESII